LSGKSERELRQNIEAVLNELIDKVFKEIREANKDSIEGRLKQSFIDILFSPKEIKKGIPELMPVHSLC